MVDHAFFFPICLSLPPSIDRRCGPYGKPAVAVKYEVQLSFLRKEMTWKMCAPSHLDLPDEIFEGRPTERERVG